LFHVLREFQARDSRREIAGCESEGAAVKPLAIDLFCGLGGWTDGLLAEGYDVIGFDIERHEYDGERYPAQLVLQDALTLHGSQFKDVALIVASPPCQEYSYMAMPWSKAKEIRRQYLSGERNQAQLTALFDACFRIQREASAVAGRHIPLVVENVRGAQEWVGRSRWNFGSFHLWGDVPALMPITFAGIKAPGLNWSDQSKRGQDFTRHAAKQTMKNGGGSGDDGIKLGGTWFHDYAKGQGPRNHSSKSKAASARIAKIPLVLSSYIAQVFHPRAGGIAA
jgi:hypothetical protein